jgi:hypothetical protein
MQARWLIFVLCMTGCVEAVPSAGSLQGQCLSCHPQQAEAHAASRHGQAATSAVFLALRARAEQTWAAAEFCDGCHLPVGGTESGLGCLTCHASAGNLGRGDGALLFDLDQPIRAAKRTGRSAHAVSETGFLASAELCATCHEVRGPGPFQESVFEHWQKAPAGEGNVTCQDCHMSQVPGVPDEAPVQHRPVGLVGGSDEEIRGLLGSAVDLRIVDRAGGVLTAEIKSLSTGHHLPDGASFLRALWVEVRVHGVVRGERHWLSAGLYAGEQEVVVPTEADRAESRALAPHEVRRLSWSVPDSASAQVCLRFQRYRPEMVSALGLDAALAGPIIEVRCTPGAE